MSEPDLTLLGANIRQLQADMRTLRHEISSPKRNFAEIMNRIATFEAVFETRLDQQTILIDQRFDQLIEIMERTNVR